MTDPTPRRTDPEPPAPQAILGPLTRSAIFLTLVIDPGGEGVVGDLLADIAGLQRSVGFRRPEARLTVVTGIGSTAWDRLFTGPKPAGLHPFVPLRGPKHSAPATPGDLLFHIRAANMDLCFELAQRLMDRLAGAAHVVDEVHGFRFFDLRDLLGFVDGTENPPEPAATRSVLIGDQEPDFAGGSYVVVQKYRHDLTAWNALSVADQEKVIGRSKLEDIEFADKAPDAHTQLTVIEEPDGTQRQIVRDNMPFGAVGTAEFGTYFIGYAADVGVTELMLRRMFLGDPPGTHDRILDFSTAVTGGLFHVPSQDFLDDPPLRAATEEPGSNAATDAPTPSDPTAPAPSAPPADTVTGSGSLHVGSLRSVAPPDDHPATSKENTGEQPAS